MRMLNNRNLKIYKMKNLTKLIYWISNLMLSIPIVIYLLIVFYGMAAGYTNEIGENCCTAIKRFGDSIGLSYYAANIFLFVVLDPLIIIMLIGSIMMDKKFKTDISGTLAKILIPTLLLITDLVILRDPTLINQEFPII